MTRADLLNAQAEALEWVLEAEQVHVSTGSRHIQTRITNLRAEAAKAADPLCIGKDPTCPCQDGDACHYEDAPGTKAWKAADPQPVAYLINWHDGGTRASLDPCHEDHGVCMPLYAHPDPRIAEYRELLRALDSLTNPDNNFDSAINPGPERDELLAAYTACKGIAR